MIFKIIFTPEAENDIQDAADYYFNKISQKVGISFFADLNSSLDSIEQNPYYLFPWSVAQRTLVACVLCATDHGKDNKHSKL